MISWCSYHVLYRDALGGWKSIINNKTNDNLGDVGQLVSMNIGWVSFSQLSLHFRFVEQPQQQQQQRQQQWQQQQQQ